MAKKIHDQESSISLGMFGLVTGVSLMLISLILDYKAKTEGFALWIGDSGHSFALFTELIFMVMLITFAFKGADLRLITTAALINGLLFIVGVVILYG